MIATFLILIVCVFILLIILSCNVDSDFNSEPKPTLREDAFYEHANKYVKKIAPPWLVKDLKSYANRVVAKMLAISKDFKAKGIDFKLADEMDLIECSLELCLKQISMDDFYNYLGHVKNARVVNTPPRIVCMAELLIREFFPLEI